MKPTILSENYQIQSNKVREQYTLAELKRKSVNITPTVIVPVRGNCSIQVDLEYEVLNSANEQICSLIHRGIFRLTGVENNTETRKVVEQLLYKTYGSFLEAYKFHYKNTIIDTYSPPLPTDLSQSVEDVMTLLFL